MLGQNEGEGKLLPVDLSFKRTRSSSQNESVGVQYKSKRSASRLNFSAEKGNGKTLNDLEEDFIYAAEFGDIPTVQKILEDNPHFNVDFSDILGRTPLRLAVGNEHLEVVDLLLDRSGVSNIYEALLQAISSGHEQIAESILKHPKYQGMKKEQKKFGETDHFFTTANEDSPFSSDITPLILASERNQIEIVQLLLLRGETIRKPHHYYCNCQECSNKLQYDQLRLAKTRLNAYKGQSSGVYISLSSKDPILTAFELAKELRAVAKVEKYYKTDYIALADQLSAYVVTLLDKVRGHDELEILINKTGKNSDEETYERLSRFKLAIKYKEKKFVAHPSCQQKLVSIWYSDLRALERSNWFFRSLLVAMVTLVYPLMCILYLFAPKSRVGRFLRYPCIKFIGHTMSFLVFLVMLVTSSAMENPGAETNISHFQPQYQYYQEFREDTVVKLRENSSLPEDFRIRVYQPQTINLVLSLWIIGMLWQNLKQVFCEGVNSYFDTLYNHLEFTVLALYITSFTLRFLSLMKAGKEEAKKKEQNDQDLHRLSFYEKYSDRANKVDSYQMLHSAASELGLKFMHMSQKRIPSLKRVSQAISYFEDRDTWVGLRNGKTESQEKFYWLIADRLFWDSWDPHNLAEGMFAVANVLSFTRLSYLLPANELFGPMQISLAKMIGDILKFGAVFMVVFCAFMVGLHNLYWYYPKEVRKHVELVENHIKTHAESHFGIPENTLKTVFWSLFGRGELTVVELGQFDHYFTETVGYWMFGVYNIATVIVLLNMLIAMMSRSFEIIQGEADTEWKFARSKLYMDYIRDDSTLPVPFNIVPSPKSLFYVIRSCFRRCCGEEEEDAHQGRVADLELPRNFQNGVTGKALPKMASSDKPQAYLAREEQDRNSQRLQNYKTRLQTSNGFFRSDSDQNLFSEKLTYKRVMKRIVKRYIFDLQREQDANDGDFDEIKQDISSFRYEMLNHINVREMDTIGTKDKLDRLYGKLDSVIVQQKQLVRSLSTSDESNATRKYFLSTWHDSIRSSTDTESLYTYKDEDDDDAVIPRFKKTAASMKSIKSDCDERIKSEIDKTKLSPKCIPSKRDEMLKRQDVIGSSLEEDTTDELVGIGDIEVRVITSPNQT